MFSAAGTSFVGRLYSLFGLVNIADAAGGEPYPELSEEFIVTADPDLIFLADAQCCGVGAASVVDRAGWADVPAVRNGHIYELDADVASRWGPRIVDMVERIAAVVSEVQAGHALGDRRRALVMAAAVAGVLGAALLAIFVGPAGLPARGILLALADGLPGIDVDHGLTAAQHAVLWQIRLPRVVLGALVGGTLAIAGAAYQGVFRNPLADPYLLGVSSGAGLGATAMIVFGLAATAFAVPMAAFAGGILAVTATYLLGRGVGGAAPKWSSSWPGSRWPPSPTPDRPSCSSVTTTRCARSTAGCSAAEHKWLDRGGCRAALRGGDDRRDRAVRPGPRCDGRR